MHLLMYFVGQPSFGQKKPLLNIYKFLKADLLLQSIVTTWLLSNQSCDHGKVISSGRIAKAVHRSLKEAMF